MMNLRKATDVASRKRFSYFVIAPGNNKYI